MSSPLAWQAVDAKELWPLRLPSNASSHNEIDPYAVWAAATGFRGFTANAQFQGPPGETWVSVIAKAHSVDALQRLHVSQTPLASRWLFVSDAYRVPARLAQAGLTQATFFTGRVRVRDLWRLRACEFIERWELGLPARSPVEEEGPDGLSRPPVPPPLRKALATRLTRQDEAGATAFFVPADLTKRGVVAAIDFGCAVFNAQFNLTNDAGPCRIACLWDQHERRVKAPLGWQASFGFAYGSTLAADALDRVRGTEPEADDTVLYHAIGYLHERALRDHPIKTHSHGTHVLATAAGRDDPWARVDPGIAPGDAASRAWLHFAHLPIETAVDSSGGSLAVHVLDAVRDVLLRYAAPTPTVVVLSQGTHAGPHDGSSLIEQALDELLTLRGENFAIVIGAGNSGRLDRGHSSGCHAECVVVPDTVSTLALHLPEADTTDTYVELWYERPAALCGLQLRVLPPMPHAPSDWVAMGDSVVAVTSGAVQVCIVHAADPPTGKSPMALLALSPSSAQNWPSVPAGIWHIELRTTGGATIPVHAWVERDEPLRGVSPDWPCFVGEGVSTASTLNTLANGHHTVVVGAMQFNNQIEAPYSSHGPALVNGRTGPDALAAADESAATLGVRAAAVRSGQTVRMSGTSVAAPTFARRLFNGLLAAQHPVTRAQMPKLVKQVLADNPSTTRLP